MQSLPAVLIPHEVECAGIDWITGTAQEPSTRMHMWEFAEHQHRRLVDAGQEIKQAYRLGYSGFQSEQFFYGSRAGSSMIVASSATAHSLFRSIRQVSDNISRLDLQVTVSLPKERLHIARNLYQRLQQKPPCDVKVRNFTLIQTDPQGETLNVNKRSSDAYARVYDKAAESGQGIPLSRWRYEVEFKRNPAKAISDLLSGTKSPQVAARGIVFDWFDARGVAPVFSRGNLCETRSPIPSPKKHHVLDWFRDSLSITVGKAIERHGLMAVLDSLCLTERIAADNMKEDKHGDDS